MCLLELSNVHVWWRVCTHVSLLTHLRLTLLYLKQSLSNTRSYTLMYTHEAGADILQRLGSCERWWHRELAEASSVVSISIIIFLIRSGEDQVQQQKWQQWQNCPSPTCISDLLESHLQFVLCRFTLHFAHFCIPGTSRWEIRHSICHQSILQTLVKINH